MNLYLVSWLWVEGPTPLCVCKSLDSAKRAVTDRLENVTPGWNDGDTFSHAVLNIMHEGATLQGAMIQQVPLYEVEHA